MKLKLKMSGFGDYDKELIVEWTKDVLAFPHFAKYDNRFWAWIFYDKDPTGSVDTVLLFSEHTEAAMPCDLHGIPFPVTDLDLMFGTSMSTAKCECGTDKYGAGNHSNWCPKWTN